MTGIDIATLADVAKDPEASAGITNFLKNVAENLSYVEKILGTFQKMGVSPAVLEKIAIKFGDLDKVPSLPETSRGIIPKSETHRTVFTQLNDLSDTQLIELSKKMQAAEKEKEKKSK
jgi:hypothetical protein